VSSPTDTGTLIGLPNDYFVPSLHPSHGFVYRELYYWDSYFMTIGLLASGRTAEAKGVVDDFLTMIARFGMVPNANRYYMLSRSQPPMLTSMINAIFQVTQDSPWQTTALEQAKREYETVWMASEQPHNRLVHAGLSRYYDINVLHDLAEAESGWDYTPRFESRCLDWVPVDLNSYLYQYEVDFAAAAQTESDRTDWQNRADSRVEQMQRHMFDSEVGLYLDYDYVNFRRAATHSLASYVPLFVGLVNQSEAAAAAARIKWFLTPYGVNTTRSDQGMSIGKQWASPNGWAPLVYMTVKGLQRYGYHQPARQIARRWLKLNLALFNRTGEFYEKYNVLEGSTNVLDGVYPAQVGYGWTNAIFAALAREFVLAEEQS
jgi:alpha,alpha-trehalase